MLLTSRHLNLDLIVGELVSYLRVLRASVLAYECLYFTIPHPHTH